MDNEKKSGIKPSKCMYISSYATVNYATRFQIHKLQILKWTEN